MTLLDDASFSAGQETGTRRAAAVARLAARRLVEEARWWNRWRLRLMARALEACAEELDACAIELGASGGGVDGALGAADASPT